MSENVETIVLKKPKKERSPAQLAATARLVESNRLKREAKKLAAEGAKAPEKAPEKKVSEDKPIEAVVKKVRKPRVKKAPPPPPPVEHYIDEDSQSDEQYEEEEFEEIREPEPEPQPVRSFRIPRHMRN